MKNNDFPFTKITNGACDLVDRGWSRRAIQTMKTSSGAMYIVQATIWKDKKIVGWLHTIVVGSEVVKVRRRIKGHHSAVKFDAPLVQKKYAVGFNGVDLLDKDSAKYSTSLRTNRWYLHKIFYS